MSDKVTRSLEKHVLSGDLEAVPALARAYERGGKELSVYVVQLVDTAGTGDDIFVYATADKANEEIKKYILKHLQSELVNEESVPIIESYLNSINYKEAIDLFEESSGILILIKKEIVYG